MSLQLCGQLICFARKGLESNRNRLWKRRENWPTKEQLLSGRPLGNFFFLASLLPNKVKLLLNDLLKTFLATKKVGFKLSTTQARMQVMFFFVCYIKSLNILLRPAQYKWKWVTFAHRASRQCNKFNLIVTVSLSSPVNICAVFNL